MAHVINDNCVKCGACADACPIGCISEGEDKYVIDADACIECGSCAYVCPARIPLVAQFRLTKGKIQAKRAAERAKAEAEKKKAEAEAAAKAEAEKPAENK